MKINIRGNTDRVIRDMGRFAKQQAPYATSKAINAVAKKAVKEIDKQIKAKIDNPTAFTVKATFISYSNKNKKPITAIVGVKDKQAKYLEFVEEGGVSIAIGKAKPVPVWAFTNKAGNIPRGKIKRILSDKKRYFSGTPLGGNRPAGLYQRLGTTSNKSSPKLRMLASWHKKTRHRPRTRFGERVALRVHRDFEKELRKHIMLAFNS